MARKIERLRNSCSDGLVLEGPGTAGVDNQIRHPPNRQVRDHFKEIIFVDGDSVMSAQCLGERETFFVSR